MKLTELVAPGLDPFGRTGFDNFCNLGNGQRSREAEKKMDVIFYTTNSKGRTILVVQDGGQIGMKFRTDPGCEYRCSAFGTEHHVNENAG